MIPFFVKKHIISLIYFHYSQNSKYTILFLTLKSGTKSFLEKLKIIFLN
jgi:hypothetical protein